MRDATRAELRRRRAARISDRAVLGRRQAHAGAVAGVRRPVLEKPRRRVAAGESAQCAPKRCRRLTRALSRWTSGRFATGTSRESSGIDRAITRARGTQGARVGLNGDVYSSSWRARRSGRQRAPLAGLELWRQQLASRPRRGSRRARLGIDRLAVDPRRHQVRACARRCDPATPQRQSAASSSRPGGTRTRARTTRATRAPAARARGAAKQPPASDKELESTRDSARQNAAAGSDTWSGSASGTHNAAPGATDGDGMRGAWRKWVSVLARRLLC